MNPIELVKKHPIMVGGAAVIIIGGAFLLFGGSGADEDAVMTVGLPGASGPSDASIQAGMQIQAMGIAAKQAETEVLAAKEISLATIAAGVTKAEYEKLTAFHVADLTAQTAQKDIAAKSTANFLGFKLASQGQSQNYTLNMTKTNAALKLGLADINAKKTVALTAMQNEMTRFGANYQIEYGKFLSDKYINERAITKG